MAQKTALGKGLGAILGEYSIGKSPAPVQTPSPVKSPASVSEIDLDLIVPNPFQPRVDFDREALEELADSIRNLGIIQPVTLRQTNDGKYQIISGERRFRASRIAGLKTVPAYIRKADEVAMLEMAIVENIQRENLDPIETALGFQRLIDECSLTQEAMAIRVGKKRATITNYLRLLRLPPQVQKAIKTGAISNGHAKVLLSLEDPASQIRFCEKTIRDGLSVRVLEDKVKSFIEGPKPKARGQVRESYSGIASRLVAMGAKVTVKCNPEGGSLTVRFASDAEAEEFLEKLGTMNLNQDAR